MRFREIIDNKSRSEWESLIYEWIHSAENRAIIIRYLLDGLTVEAVAEEFNLSVTGAQKRINKARNQLFKHI